MIGFDAGFGELVRHELAHGAWVDHQPGWVRGHDRLFDELERGLDWRSEQRHMYERTVTVPRLLAGVPGMHTIEPMRQALSARYGEDFVRLMAALYRDGNDSVAWHGDTTARDMDQAVVATVSLASPGGSCSSRPTAGGRSRSPPDVAI